MNVIKRSGEVEIFNRDKLKASIDKACRSVSTIDEFELNTFPELVTRQIEDDLIDKVEITTKDLGLLVQGILYNKVSKEVGQNYTIYQYEQDKLGSLNPIKITEDYLGNIDWRINENASISYSIGGYILGNSGAVTANYWLNKIYPKEVADAHRSCKMHIHDLGMLSSYCFGNDLQDLIKRGITGPDTKTASAPPKHFSTLCNQMVNYLGIMSLEFAGAQAFSSVDTLSAPFIKMDKLTYDEVKQEVQSLMFGLNTPSRWGGQPVFSNFTFDLVPTKDLKNKKAIVGGVEQDFMYGDCQAEMDMFNKAFLELLMDGDCNGRGFQYPIPTYNVTKDFPWEDANMELLFKITAKYGTPYFTNYINSEIDPSEARSMCPLTSDTEIIVKLPNKVTSMTLKELKDLNTSFEVHNSIKNCWMPAKLINIYNQNKLDITVSTIPDNIGKPANYVVCMGEHHLQPKRVNNELVTVEASELKIGDKVPSVYIDFDYIITDIKPSNNDNELMCVQILTDSNDDNDHLFDLTNGLITHNCRLRLDLRELWRKGGGLFGANSQTGSIGVVTINMPQLGYLCKGNKDKFYKELRHLMDLAKESLEIKRNIITKLTDKGFFPYVKHYVKTFDTCFSTIGLNGMHECILNFTDGEYGIDSDKGQQFAIDTLTYMRNVLADYQEETGSLYNLEASPAEGTSFRLAMHDKKNFPSIITAGTPDAPYYTNSTWLPVNATSDPFEMLDHQEPLQTLYTGGTVAHVLLGDAIKDWKIVRDFVKIVFTNYKIPYITISPTYSICKKHGYLPGEQYECPKCKEEKRNKLLKEISELEDMLIKAKNPKV